MIDSGCMTDKQSISKLYMCPTQGSMWSLYPFQLLDPELVYAAAIARDARRPCQPLQLVQYLQR